MRTLTRLSPHAVLDIVIVVAFVQAPISAFGLAPVIVLSQVQKDEWAGGSDEAWTRKMAIKKVMPIYPEEALRLGISGHVEVKIAITEEGEVARIKVRPRIDPRLKAAVADAVKQWKFKPHRDQDGLGRPILSHLTFNFVASEGRVELHTPGPDAPDSEHLGYYNSAKEQRQWREWEEIEFSQASPKRNQP